MPGLSSDFAIALVGPPGLYLRNDVAWFAGRVNAVTLGDRVFTSAKQSVWVDVAKLIWLAPSGILGGRFGAVASVPTVVDATAKGRLVEPVDTEISGNLGGFGDVNLSVFFNTPNDAQGSRESGRDRHLARAATRGNPCPGRLSRSARPDSAVPAGRAIASPRTARARRGRSAGRRTRGDDRGRPRGGA